MLMYVRMLGLLSRPRWKCPEAFGNQNTSGFCIATCCSIAYTLMANTLMVQRRRFVRFTIGFAYAMFSPHARYLVSKIHIWYVIHSTRNSKVERKQLEWVGFTRFHRKNVGMRERMTRCHVSVSDLNEKL